MRCNVLPLDDALARLHSGSLPARSVAITFDDGNHDFYRQAFPVLREYNFPATVYLTTYYCLFNRPVFDVMLSYLHFKGLGRTLDWPELFGEPIVLNTNTRGLLQRFFRCWWRIHGLSGEEKDTLLRNVAHRLHIDYDALCHQRLLHIMKPEEVREIAAAGIDVQLHTHRHRVSNQKDPFDREIRENGTHIQNITGKQPLHFCYPGGFTLATFSDWLQAAGIQSATTTEFGLASARDNRYLLPRILDASHVTQQEFEAWVSGTARLMPQRPAGGPNVQQLLETPVERLETLQEQLRLANSRTETAPV